MITNRHAAHHTLGISIGATNLVAALGSQTVVHPAVLHTAQGGWLSGFVDRIGDPVPLVASDGSTHRPEALLSEALDAVVTALPKSGPVSGVAVTVPAHWPASTVDTLRASLPHRTRLVPDASAALWALRANPGLPSRGVIVVCDFGGSGTSITLFDAAARSTRIGDTVRYGDFSGDLIDQAILRKVVSELGDADRTDPSGTAMVGSLTRLREACRMAKHRLSADTATGIAVDLPGQQTSIRLTRTELEHLLEEPVAGFLAALDDVLESNGVAPAEVSAIATIGGGARIPLLTQRLSQHLRVQVVTTPHPQLVAATGAALLAAGSQVDETATTLTPTAPSAAAPATAPATVPANEAPAALAWSQDDSEDVAAPLPLEFSPLEFSRPDMEFGERDWDDMPPRRRGPLIAFGVSAAAAVAALAVFGMTQFDGETAPASASSSIAVSTAPVTSTQPAASPAAETATVVVTPAPRLVPVGQPRPQQPAPGTVTVPPPTTTTATPTTTTTPTTSTTTPTTTTPTTPTTTTSTTTPTSPPATTTPPIPIDPGPGNGF